MVKSNFLWKNCCRNAKEHSGTLDICETSIPQPWRRMTIILMGLDLIVLKYGSLFFPIGIDDVRRDILVISNKSDSVLEPLP
jgi:hypothetical protein